MSSVARTDQLTTALLISALLSSLESSIKSWSLIGEVRLASPMLMSWPVGAPRALLRVAPTVAAASLPVFGIIQSAPLEWLDYHRPQGLV